MSFLDDAIGLFSPGWKASRLRARAVIKAYEAVKQTRTHKAQKENRSADQLSQMGAVSLRQQAFVIERCQSSLPFLTAFSDFRQVFERHLLPVESD